MVGVVAVAACGFAAGRDFEGVGVVVVVVVVVVDVVGVVAGVVAVGVVVGVGW